MKYRLNSYKMIYNLSKLEEGNEKLSMALDIVNKDLLKLSNGDWTGESNKAAKDIVSILQKFHFKLLDIGNDDLKIKRKFLSNADNYMSSGEIPQEWK